MRNLGRNRRSRSLVLVAGLLAAGCSPVQDDAELPQNVPADAALASEFPVGREWKHTVAWRTPTEFWRDLYDLWQHTLAACMADHGFVYVPVQFVNDDVTWTYLNPLNEAIADGWGYDVPDVEPLIPKENLNRGEAFDAALQGDDGCGFDGADVVFNDPIIGPFIDANESIGEEIYESISGWENSPDGIALTDEWSECMANAGLTFSSQLDAVEKYADRGASSEELAVRAADLECDRAVGLTKTRSEFEGQQFAEWIDSNEDLINDLTAQLSAAQARLAELLAGLAAKEV